MEKTDCFTRTKGYSMRCDSHTYITLFYDGQFVHCFDNELHLDDPSKDEYYTEHIIATIEKRTKMKITDIPIIGCVEDFDGLRFLHGGFKKGHEWLNQNQVIGIKNNRVSGN